MSSVARPLPLGPADIHVWLIELTADLVAEADLHILDPAELARADRFHFHTDRSRWIRSRAALRRVLGRYLALAPAMLGFELGIHGKPYLRAAEGLHFNLSHTKDMAAVAVALGRPVGIDVERVRPIDDPGFVRQVLSPAEHAFWLTLPTAARPFALLRSWCAKEAYAKALGIGLGLSFTDVETALGTAAVIAAADGGLWHLRSFESEPDHAIVLAASGPIAEVGMFTLKGQEASAGTPIREMLPVASPALALFGR
jgi:4'-phosphopantetheinyl transferase